MAPQLGSVTYARKSGKALAVETHLDFGQDRAVVRIHSALWPVVLHLVPLERLQRDARTYNTSTYAQELDNGIVLLRSTRLY